MNGKLIPNLFNKTKYILHYKALQKYIELGLEVTKVHKVIQFNQRAWLKHYIEFNINKRINARNDFEKKFYKDLNNSLFGKTIENQRKYNNNKLIMEDKLEKYVTKPSFKDSNPFENKLHAVHMKNSKIILNKPKNLGMPILDISKVIMFDFHYNYMCKFPNKKLLFTDTDSLTYEIKTSDFYEEIIPDLEYFDTAGYPKEHFLYSSLNNKVVGKFKDEVNGQIIVEFVGLRPKLYSFITDNWYYESDEQQLKLEKNTKKSKGTDKSTKTNVLRHQHYRDCLTSKESFVASVTRIKSSHHNLSTITTQKIILSYQDDKRVLINDFNTLALGHYSLMS